MSTATLTPSLMRFPEQFRWRNPAPGYSSSNGDRFGAFAIPATKALGRSLKVIATDAIESGFEHVSVSVFGSRDCPTWDEMCLVKDLFWKSEACVVQFHPPRSQYVNQHPGCLHLWCCLAGFPTPPRELV